LIWVAGEAPNNIGEANMPRRTPVAYRFERIAVMRQYLEMGASLRDYIFEEHDMKRDYDAPALTWVAAAVALGHAEGRPMNASKIAEYLKLDRVTVMRKLDKLIDAGIIVRDGDDYFMPAHRAANIPHRTLRRYAQIFARAAKVMTDFVKKILGVQHEQSHR
jgi:hypothetical protein